MEMSLEKHVYYSIVGTNYRYQENYISICQHFQMSQFDAGFQIYDKRKSHCNCSNLCEFAGKKECKCEHPPKFLTERLQFYLRKNDWVGLEGCNFVTMFLVVLEI